MRTTFLLAATLAAGSATAEQKPWLEMLAGPVALHQTGRSGFGSGPLVRLTAGLPFGERAAGELWMSGSLESAPQGARGDHAFAAVGLGGRVLLHHFDADGKLGLWARAGAGWAIPAAGEGRNGPTGFGGALLSFQPFTKRFQLGLEVDVLGYRSTVGAAVLPQLRCQF